MIHKLKPNSHNDQRVINLSSSTTAWLTKKKETHVKTKPNPLKNEANETNPRSEIRWKWEKKKKNQNKTQNSERNVRGSCGEGPETWSRCSLPAPKKGLSLIIDVPKHAHITPPFSIWSITEILKSLWSLFCLSSLSSPKSSLLFEIDWREDGTERPRGSYLAK